MPVDISAILSGDRGDVTAEELAELVRLARIGRGLISRGVLVIRCGDADDYRAFDGPREAGEDMRERGVVGPLERAGVYGLSAPGYEGLNYISCYWGREPIGGPTDKPVEITDDDLAEMNAALEVSDD